MQRSSKADAVTELILETFRLNGQLLEAGDRLTAPLGLTSARWQVLGAINNAGQPLTVAQIGRRMGLSRQSVQRVVNDLESSGFVGLKENPDHKRAKLVVLTPSCRKTLAKLDGIQAKWADELAEGLSQTAIRQAVKLMIEIRECSAAIEGKAK
jgi:DNA-binding MarR family transcriptional regulator